MTIRPTIDHVTLRVSDLAASRRFYEAAMSPLGLGLAFGGGEGGRLIVYATGPGDAGVHVGYYGAYALDPDGNNIEAVHHTRPPLSKIVADHERSRSPLAPF